MSLFKITNRIKRMKIKLRSFIKDGQKKNYLKIICEIIYLAIKRRDLPTYYFSNFLYRKDAKNVLNYISNKEARCILRQMHCPATYQVLDNKLFIQNHFSRLGIPMPRMIAYNYKCYWFREEKGLLIRKEIRSFEEFIAMLKVLFMESGKDEMFIKPIVSFGGKGASRLARDSVISCKGQTKDLENLYGTLNKGCFIIQENIVQHSEMSRLNPTSVNTIRVVTYNSLSSPPEIISAFLRIGRYGNEVDNVMSGGMFVSVDLDSGKLSGKGFTELEHGGRVFSAHPDSEIKLKEYNIPYFAEINDMACKAAVLISSKLVGWDIAVTDTGPILIEANHWIHLGVLDAAYGGLRRNEVFRKVLLEAGIKP